MIPTPLHYQATLDSAEIEARLEQLLVPGPLSDPGMSRRIVRLEERFHTFAALAPFGLWARGLAITGEMRSYTEVHLPLAEIAGAFRRLLRLALRLPSNFEASPLQTAGSWLDFLHATQSLVGEANPASLLRRLMHDDLLRGRFLFSLFLPARYGGGFSRYQGQEQFLRSWLRDNGRENIRCLDAACGSGEGSYDLALLLQQNGHRPERFEVLGVTIDPLEVFAAAHGWFPHDPCRQERVRLFRESLTESVCSRIVFSLGDFRFSGSDGVAEGFDVILCNGILGGPFLHDRAALSFAVAHLCSQLKSDGILLIADRFHGGWKRLVPRENMQEMLVRNGLTLVDVQEGVGGKK